MRSEGYEQMLTILKELFVYKALERDYKAGPKGRAEIEAYEERERRRQGIKQEMQDLATESKKSPA